MSEVTRQLDSLENKLADKSSMTELQEKIKNELDTEIKTLKETHSQSFKNHSAKMMNEITKAFQDSNKISQVKWDRLEGM